MSRCSGVLYIDLLVAVWSVCVGAAVAAISQGDGPTSIAQKRTPLRDGSNKLNESAVEGFEDAGARLMRAAREGLVNEVDVLITKNKIDPNEKDEGGRTAIWYAAANGYVDLVTYLLERRADPGISNNQGNAPLSIAAQNGVMDVVEVLLAAEVEVDHKNRKGASPLMIASQMGHKTIVQRLIDAGADVDARKSNSRQSALWSAAFLGHTDIVKTLIEGGALVDAPEKDGATPLFAASQEGHEAVVQLLLDAGADPNSQMENDVSPLHISAAVCEPSAVATLVGSGASPDVEDAKGRTPADLVCMDSHGKKSKGKRRAILRSLRKAASSGSASTVVENLDVERRSLVLESKAPVKVVNNERSAKAEVPVVVPISAVTGLMVVGILIAIARHKRKIRYSDTRRGAIASYTPPTNELCFQQRPSVGMTQSSNWSSPTASTGSIHVEVRELPPEKGFPLQTLRPTESPNPTPERGLSLTLAPGEIASERSISPGRSCDYASGCSLSHVPEAYTGDDWLREDWRVSSPRLGKPTKFDTEEDLPVSNVLELTSSMMLNFEQHYGSSSPTSMSSSTTAECVAFGGPHPSSPTSTLLREANCAPYATRPQYRGSLPVNARSVTKW